jgi:hypothetical protein
MANQGDGSASNSIKVLEECKYSFDHIATFHDKHALGDIALEYEKVFTSEGLLIMKDEITELDATLKTNAKYLDYHATNDECNAAAMVATYSGGTGKVEVKSQIDGKELAIWFWNPNVEATTRLKVPCKHDPIDEEFPDGISTPTGTLWVEESFPLSGGTRQIKIDKLEKYVEIINKSPGGVAYYSAVLSVRRVK